MFGLVLALVFLSILHALSLALSLSVRVSVCLSLCEAGCDAGRRLRAQEARAQPVGKEIERERGDTERQRESIGNDIP